jgi:Fe-S cluster assembly protein SufD
MPTEPTLPTTEAESWRYTPINTLDLTDRPTLVSTVEVAAAGAGQPGVEVGTSAKPDAPPAYPEPDGLTALHDEQANGVVTVRVAKGAVAEQPIEISVNVPDGRSISFPHVVVDMGEASEATVVLTMTGGGDGAIVVPVVDLKSGTASNLRYVGLQQLDRGTWQLGHLLGHVQRDATLLAWLTALGGEYAREYVSISLAEQGASAKIAGIYFGDEQQILDFRSLQDHTGTRSVSDFRLRGAVVDDARGVYTGLIRVHEGAKATESFLGNRNLVLSDGAHVDSVPNLEIVNENDIRSCGHASATGPVDEEHVFYLESRGVPPEVAERLIVTGFFDEFLDAIPVASVARSARETVYRKLDKLGSHG